MCEHTCEVFWSDLQDLRSEFEDKIEALTTEVEQLRDRLSEVE